MSKLKRGKAAERDEISSEHLLFSHPVFTLVLIRLFNIMLLIGVLPGNFCESSTVFLKLTILVVKNLMLAILEVYLCALSYQK